MWCFRLAPRRAERCTIVQSALRFHSPFFPLVFESLRNPRSPQPLIRARSVVQVHPGPPFKSPINTRRFSLFPSWEILLKKPICQLFANFRIGRMALHSGALRPFGWKAKRLASIRLCRECCPLTSKDVQGSARRCKLVEGAGSHF